MPRSTSSFRIVRVLLIVSGLFVVLSPAIRGQSTNLSSKVNGTLPNGSLFRGSAAEITQSNMQGLITVQPKSGPFKAAQTGVLKLGLGSTNRDGYLYVPPQYDSSKASSFILAIHAAGKSGMDALQLLYSSAASSGIMVLAPDSRGATWDDLPAAQGSFGPDIAFINAALAQTFALYNVDATKLGIQGFSDGATYALGLGMIDGQLFRKVMANSPGGILADSSQGQPPIFISAGLQDNIFPIQQAGNADTCYLKQLGYRVTYVQFNGGHEVPANIVSDTIQWFQGSYPQTNSIPSGVCSR